MDKKAKKRLEVIREKVTKLRQLLNAAKAQPDDPEEPARLQAEITALEKEAEQLRAAK